jgi:hypothetical protein
MGLLRLSPYLRDKGGGSGNRAPVLFRQNEEGTMSKTASGSDRPKMAQDQMTVAHLRPTVAAPETVQKQFTVGHLGGTLGSGQPGGSPPSSNQGQGPAQSASGSDVGLTASQNQGAGANDKK